METTDLMQLINQKYKMLSKGQKQIAQYILDNYDKAAFITASKMGQIVGVSESTVVRFAYAMNYDGYPELQRSLQELIRNKLTSVQRMQLSADLKESEVLKSVFKTDMNNIRATIDALNEPLFNSVVAEICEATHIYVLGLRSSLPLAQFLSYYLNFLRDDVRLIGVGPGDIPEQLLSIGAKDVVLGISFPRYCARTIDTLHYVRESGAHIIAITDSFLSPLCGLANYSLIAKSDMASFADSLVAPLSLINALIVAVSMRLGTSVEERFHKLEHIWDSGGTYMNHDG